MSDILNFEINIDTSKESLEDLEKMLKEIREIEAKLANDVAKRKLYSHKHLPTS